MIIALATYHIPTPHILTSHDGARCDNVPPTSQSDLPVNATRRNAIITSVQKKDETTTDWLFEDLPEWEPIVYVTDRRPSENPTKPSKHTSPRHLALNQGREAAVYLTYIVDNYFDLPDYMVFIHGKRYQIHNDDPMFDTLPTISRLNLDYVKEQGYTSLRCNLDTCPKPAIEPSQKIGIKDDWFEYAGMYATAWQEFFPGEPVPDAVVGPCCAQFAVTREAVHKRPLEFYETARHWLWRYNRGRNFDPMLDQHSGYVFEYMWHVIWDKPSIFCPDAKECYCKKWGMCDLECETPGWCLGTMWFNPNKTPTYLGGIRPGLPVSLSFQCSCFKP